MTDFYSVLKSSIIQRNLRSAEARYNAYDQAREAMVRRLWSFNPPLSEDEIGARIGLFDAAVERIEADLAQSFTGGEDVDRHRAPLRLRQEPPAEQTGPPHAYEIHYQEVDRAARTEPRSTRYRSEAPPPPADARDRDEGVALNGRWQRPSADQPRNSQARVYDQRSAELQMLEPRDDDWQVAETYVADSRPRLHEPEPPDWEAAGQPPDHEHDSYGEPVYEQDIAEAGRTNFHYLPSVVDSPGPDDAYGDEYAYGGEGYDQEDDDREPRYEEAAYYEYDGEEPHAAMPARRGPSPYSAHRAANTPPANGAYGDAVAPARHHSAERRSGNRTQAKGGGHSRRAGGRSVPILAVTIGALAVMLIAFNVYVFLPILLGSDTSRSTVVTSPPKGDDRLPSLESATPPSAQVVSDSATAIEIPERNLDVAESLVIFDGSDPTVFEGTSNNPIQFDSDTEGGFARISSAASAAGARAIIGPGLAERLAGKTVRVTLLARSSSENGAAQMRFAYQSGLAVSHWQDANLSSNYGTYGMIWRVPAADAGEHDYLLIEPGIPGDGTSTDIRMIKIDVLTS